MRIRSRPILLLLLLLGLMPVRGVFALVPNDPLFSRQWYLERIGAPAAWDVVTRSSSVVAVLDIGVDLDHPDLRDAIWANPDEVPENGIDDDGNGFVDDVHGWDFVAGDSDPQPVYDVPNSDPRDLHHGTVVAGIIAARGGNGEGGAGIDWGAKIMPLRVLRSDGSGDVDTVVAAMRYAMREGATIVNLSFVGDERSVELDESIAEATARGILVVAAGGNEDRTGRGDLDRFPVYPICAGLDGRIVLGVAATNQQDEKAVFSSYGRCVDVAAPGEQVYGTLFHDPDQLIVKVGGSITATTFRQPYGGPLSGTSFAAPVAAGAASLLRGLLPNATPADLIALLVGTADPIRNETHATAGKLGAGRLHLGRAVRDVSARAIPEPVPSSVGATVTVSAPLASVGASITARVTVRDGRGSLAVGRTIELVPVRSGDRVDPASTSTGPDGSAVFTVRSEAEGIAEFDVEVDGVPSARARTVFARVLDRPVGVGALLRGTASSVYVVGTDGNRYAFPDRQTFRSWYADDAGVQRVPDALLAAFPLGGLVTIRSGTFLVKIQTDPKVYAVEPGGVLRWVPDEVVARRLSGERWPTRVVDVPDAFFTTYRIGAPISVAHPTGALLEDARDGQRYLIAGERRRRIDSTLAFLKNGFQWRDVIRVPAVAYSDGTVITDREATLAQPVQ